MHTTNVYLDDAKNLSALFRFRSGVELEVVLYLAAPISIIMVSALRYVELERFRFYPAQNIFQLRSGILEVVLVAHAQDLLGVRGNYERGNGARRAIVEEGLERGSGHTVTAEKELPKQLLSINLCI